MRRKILRLLIRTLFRLLSKVEVVGRENLPLEGSCLLVINHLSLLDAPLIFSIIEREDVTALAADKYKSHPIFSRLVEAVNGIWINRESADFRALRTARAYLRAGWLIGIAPEGTRNPDGALIPAKTGAAYLADKARVPLVPAGISGTESALRKLLRLQRPTIRVVIGEPFTLPPVKRDQREEDLKRNTDEIMCRIAALLPPEYHGVYANHPRLRTLLQHGRLRAP